MLFLFFTEASLVCLIVLIAMKFDIYKLEIKELYKDPKNELNWLYYIPTKLPDFFYKKEVIMGIKIGTIAI